MLHSLSLKRLPLSLRGKGWLSDVLSTLPIPKQEGQNKLEVLGVELQNLCHKALLRRPPAVPRYSILMAPDIG